VSVCLFPLLVLLVALVSRHRPVALAALAASLALGGLLALYGLRLTRFERTAQGLFYTPNPYLGIALSLLLAGRILYRLVEVSAGNIPSSASADFLRSPITLVIFYVGYAIGLLRWRGSQRAGMLGVAIESPSKPDEVGKPVPGRPLD
jgi:hypothetical protein